MNILGVDTGGTFTDFVFSDGVRLLLHKVLSTPASPEGAILQGIAEMGLDTASLLVVHGSTVATNAVLEGKGVRCAYVTNRGFADVLTIGRQARRSLYDLQPPLVAPPVPAELCLETGGRLSAQGDVIEPLLASDLTVLSAALEKLQPEAVAINLLFAFLDDRAEAQIAAAVPDGVFVSRASKVLNEYREYERGMATWLNAYVGPLMQRYLGRLASGLPEASIRVMQSHGGTMAASGAGERAVELLLSGPAGGLVGALYQARRSACERVMTFDMGGTSTDVALLDGDIRLSSEGEIAGYPVAVPMVDMHTIGAGGGSIAWLDEGGMLRVGPQSAGAFPGPACYGQGGTVPTVSDANVVLGRLPSDVALGGSLALDRDAAIAAMMLIAGPLNMTVEQAAEGVIAIANEHMAQALRVISVQRGYNPADYALMCFGGAGGMHVCALADNLEMTRALVPMWGGVLSALGMLVAPQARQLSRSWLVRLAEVDVSEVDREFASMSSALAMELSGEGVAEVAHDATLDARYVGQSSTLALAWQADRLRLEQSFHNAHRDMFGHAMQMPIEIVTLRVRSVSVAQPLDLPVVLAQSPARATALVEVAGCASPVPVFQRKDLMPGQRIEGPAVIAETVSTTWIALDWCAECDMAGNLDLVKMSPV